MTKLTIDSDGTPQGTKVFADGIDITSLLKSITWRIDAKEPLAEVSVEYSQPIDVHLEGELSE